MTPRRLRYRAEDGAALRAGFDAVRRELELPEEFPAAVLAEAEDVRSAESVRSRAEDRTDIPFFTIDPPGSMDLDQALFLSRRNGGYRVQYAIADVASFVAPGGALDRECRRRVETVYFPDGRTPLHPPSLSEDSASLLPDQVRPVALWSLELDSSGEVTSVDVRRALVRSRARLDYAGVQAALDGGTAEEPLELLREVGQLRIEREIARGGVDLPIPEQEIVEQGEAFALEYRARLACEEWNAQVSLLTGMAAAQLMLDAEVGLLRTLPPPPDGLVAKLRRVASALGVSWPEGASYAAVLRGLDPAVPAQAALLEEATSLLRGAGYVAFDGAPPEQASHAALAAPYTHVTAPLRRLADRYATEVCLSVVAGAEVPEWVRAALPGLPETMATGARRSSAAERACVSLVEAVLMRDRVGDVFDAVVIDVDERGGGGEVALLDPAVRGRCEGDTLPLGERISVRLSAADPAKREVRFQLA